jgi:hypothetical protein
MICIDATKAAISLADVGIDRFAYFPAAILDLRGSHLVPINFLHCTPTEKHVDKGCYTDIEQFPWSQNPSNPSSRHYCFVSEGGTHDRNTFGRDIFPSFFPHQMVMSHLWVFFPPRLQRHGILIPGVTFCYLFVSAVP